jgi:hypothetical protein
MQIAFVLKSGRLADTTAKYNFLNSAADTKYP